MSTLRVRLPGGLHCQLRQFARREGVSVDQLVAAAVAEKLSALMTGDDWRERAARGDRGRFEAALALVPGVAPAPGDELREG